ncbi:MAG TPA: hypothetical protein PLC98_02185 [Anaerolineales bacterium]|nr:hypothetical protein [Anaerolineales bacterium]
MQELFELRLVRAGESLPFTIDATPARLSLMADGARAEICFAAHDQVQIRLTGAALQLHMVATGAYDMVIADGPDRWQVVCNTLVETKLMFAARAGRIVVDAPWEAERCSRIVLELQPEAGVGEFVIDEFVGTWVPSERAVSFDTGVNDASTEFAAWVSALPTVPAEYAEARELAGYVLWSCGVAAHEHLPRHGILASKNGMIGVWSWDHCFHTWALADAHPEQAWDQFLLPFDHQDASGAIPDLVNDRLVSWSFCKPPVHGWILSRVLQDTSLLNEARLAEIYGPLCAWTTWWLTHRDPGDGLPVYHHGNDSGWDNSTIFAVRPPIQSPDLAAYLVLQLDFLAEAARRLGRDADAVAWSTRADELLARMLARFWRGDRFVAIQTSDGADIDCDSLQLYLPLVLGQRLPFEVRAALIAGLRTPGRFVTEHGLATEALASPHYKDRGYWRGPIWPAPMLILIDGLSACGEVAFAADLRRRFCDLVARSGMAENFDARSGAGYHDFDFTWTASIFLILAHALSHT